MSVYDPTRALSVPGRLVINPTNAGLISGIYPFGGVEFGIVTRIKVTRTAVHAFYNSEARGRDGVSGYRGRDRLALTFALVQYDPTVLDTVWAFSTVSPNGYAGANILSLPQPGRNNTPGLIPAGSPLLFAADDPIHPSAIIYAPIYTFDPKLEEDLVLNKPLETAFVVVAGIDGTGRDYSQDLMENLSV